MKAIDHLRRVHGLPDDADPEAIIGALVQALRSDPTRVELTARVVVMAVVNLDDQIAAVDRASASIDRSLAKVESRAADVKEIRAEVEKHLLRAKAAAETKIAISRLDRWLIAVGYDVDGAGVVYVMTENVDDLTTALAEVNERLGIASTAIGRIAPEFRGVHEADLDAIRHFRDAMVRQRAALLEERDRKLLKVVQ